MIKGIIGVYVISGRNIDLKIQIRGLNVKNLVIVQILRDSASFLYFCMVIERYIHFLSFLSFFQINVEDLYQLDYRVLS